MKITNEILKRIIKEEMREVMKESAYEDLPDGYGGVPQEDEAKQKAKQDFKVYGGNPKFQRIATEKLITALGEDEAEKYIQYIEKTQYVEKFSNSPEEEEAILYYIDNQNSRYNREEADSKMSSAFKERAEKIKLALSKRNMS